MTCSVAMLRHPRRVGDIRTESMKEAPDDIAICKVRLRAGELPTDVDGSKNGACTDGWICHGCDAAGLRAATIAAETKRFLPHGRAAGDGDASSRRDSSGHAAVSAPWKFAACRHGPDLPARGPRPDGHRTQANPLHGTARD